MRGEIQFLMATADERDFEDFVASIEGVRLVPGVASDWLVVGGEEIQYQRSERVGHAVAIGRIAILTGAGPRNLPLPVERVYKQLRRWLRSRFFNNLCVFDVGDPRSYAPIRTVWLGPEASKLSAAGTVELRQFLSGPVGIIQLPHDRVVHSPL
jgi:hypothetical protein